MFLGAEVRVQSLAVFLALVCAICLKSTFASGEESPPEKKIASAKRGMPSSLEGQSSILRLYADVANIMVRLRAPLRLSDTELAQLLAPSKELMDPKTHQGFRTPGGNPIPFHVLEPEAPMCAPGETMRTVLFVGGVHPDEVSPIYSSFRVLLELRANSLLLPSNTRVIYVPLYNPDGLIVSTQRTGRPTRGTPAGVDLNRDLRSKTPATETRFLKELIAVYRPTHIVSLHGPFGWLDYDGPGKAREKAPLEMRAHVNQWLARTARAGRKHLGRKSAFRTYQGSLGDYAGNGLGRHVLTIEYPHAAAHFARDDFYQYGDVVIKSFDLGGVRRGSDDSL